MLVGVESCIILIWDAERQAFAPGPSYGINEMGRGLLETLALDQEEFADITPGWPIRFRPRALIL
ncbi:MAG: hypothetical protein R3D55_23970 [Chloroflexota bacterium]